MKFIVLNSNIDITVTNGLLNKDKTNYESKVGNNLNVAPLWTRTAVKIRKGKHQYPAEIADWPSVKVLEEKGIFTLSKETDEGTEEEMKMLAEFEESKRSIEAELQPKRRRKANVEESAE